jgi:hypothetical protein
MEAEGVVAVVGGEEAAAVAGPVAVALEAVALEAEALEAEALVALAAVALAVAELAVVELAVVELAAVELAVVLVLVVEARAVVAELVEPGRGQRAREEMVPAVSVAVTLSEILTLVHTDCLTRTGSARECFRFKGAIEVSLFKGAIRVCLVTAGLGALLFGSTNTRPSLVRRCGGARRTCAMFSGLTGLSG